MVSLSMYKDPKNTQATKQPHPTINQFLFSVNFVRLSMNVTIIPINPAEIVTTISVYLLKDAARIADNSLILSLRSSVFGMLSVG